MMVSSDSADALIIREVLLLFGAGVGSSSQFSGSQNAIHWRADLVTHIGHELALGPVR